MNITEKYKIETRVVLLLLGKKYNNHVEDFKNHFPKILIYKKSPMVNPEISYFSTSTSNIICHKKRIKEKSICPGFTVLMD